MTVVGLSHFFQKCLVTAFTISCLLTSGNALAGNATAEPFAVQCADVSFSECMKRFSKASGLEVIYAQSLANTMVSASINDPDPVAGLRRLLDSIGDGNHALSFDATARRINITSLGADGKAQTTSPAADSQGDQPPPKKLFPTESDIRAANQPPNPDAEVAPGMTNRELKHRAEQLDLRKPDPNSPFFPSIYGDKSISWGELQKRQQQLDQGKPVEYTLPDGQTVSAEKLKEHQERVDTMHGAKAAQNSTMALPPAPDAQGSPKRASGEETFKKNP